MSIEAINWAQRFSRQSSLMDQKISTGGTAHSPSGLRLNPQFVEWLMGLPIGWTDSGKRVTAWCHYKARLHTQLLKLLSQSVVEKSGQGLLL